MYTEEPRTLAEARASPEWEKWNRGADEEMESLKKNKTWELVKKPENRKIISCKCGDLDKKRSTSGYVFTVGDNVVSWKSRLQPVVALSTMKRVHRFNEAVKEAIWLKGLLEDFGVKQGPISIWCDSQSAICLSKNNVFHERTKHVAKRYHFIRDIIEDKVVDVLKIHTSRNPATYSTKVVPVSKFNAALEMLKVLKA
ncbi:hypothetical protein Bca101_022847 [Brassica carinata]